jgi:phenylpropionate dioxygenase-like ring-hydroxylating dioxygenase large terminal subunit
MIENAWYIACPTSRLGSHPLSCCVGDLRIVLFRDAALEPRALLDRCCHRGVQLSLGTIESGAITCRYHGWRYSGDGKCIHIPSLPDGTPIPTGIEVPSFPCVERDGYVWVYPGAPTPSELPSIDRFNSYRWHQGSVLLRCAAGEAVENNLDWVHPYFTHPWTHGQFFATQFHGFRKQQFEMRLTARGLVVFTPVTSSADTPIPERPIVRIDFELPGRVSVEFWKPFHLFIIMHFVPTGSNTCRQEWLMSRAFPFGPITRWVRRTPRVFLQDQRVLESAQACYDREGHGFERSVEADAPTLLVRRILTLAAKGQWEADRNKLVQRRIVTVRA